ncbi:MAG: glycoside hydrolase family 2 protein, partial [Clostridia bacterium]|nr:glycoside hydrolase family 2 protein [Clostridia bacterium]
MKTNLNNNWQYFDSWSEDIFGNNGGEIVRIPHANKLVPFNNYDESEVQILCGYRHIVNLTVRPSSTYLLTFEGVAHYSEVYLNGQFVGKHACGYTAFTLDITNFLQSGDNEIVVKVDSSYTLNQPPFGNVVDYQTYGGIYREVYLTEKRGTYVEDVFVQAEPLKPVVAEIKLANLDSNAEVSVEIVDGDNVVYSTCYNTQNDSITVVMDVELELWELDNPKLYTLVVDVNDDSYQTTFGVRSAQFTRDGFLLNGKPVKIVGLNRHQCYPYVGYAAPESLQRLDARMLKQTLCLNAVRTSHYPQSQHFVDECDKLGLLVF